MNKLFNLSALLIISLSVLANNPKGEQYTVNNENSSIEWKGEKVSGTHFGTIKIKHGSLDYEDGMINGGTVVIDMHTIAVDDIEDEEYNKKLTDHLKSQDFFNVNQHEIATFEILEVSKKEEKNQYLVKGSLTIKGISNIIEFPATIIKEENKIVAVGEAKIDRTKYDIKYRSGKFFDSLGDKMIYDEFTVKMKIGAAK